VEPSTVNAWEKITPILIGAALSMFGGLITQGIFIWLNRRHERNTLFVAIKTELKTLRENLGGRLRGLRDTLHRQEVYRLEDFVLPMPIFDANAGKLGQLGDIDLIEHVVEVYDNLYALSSRAKFFERIPNERIDLRDLNEIHLSATTSHLMVMKLHNRLLGVPKSEQLNQDETEKETRMLVSKYQQLLV
jgi:hypothetical protein